ncbi:MAG: SGNH/GDSL hydrolase family protein [bacterium]|nr:SGNH/GDSL hydrolase family protein [bacterium]
MTRSRSPSLVRKLLLTLGALVFALVGAEVVVRSVGSPEKPRPVIFTEIGIEAPLGEVIAYMPKMARSDHSAENGHTAPPYGLLLANLKLRWGYRPMPTLDYFDDNGCVAIDTNSLGLRDEEFEVAKAPREFRVLALGDSMTYGLGVPLAMTWPQVLEQRLRGELARPVEVINAGFAAGGYDPSFYHTWLAANGIHFEPDLVIVGLCLNDVDHGIGMLTYPSVPLKPVLGGWSLLLDRMVQLVRQSEARQTRKDFRSAITDDSPVWRATRDGLIAMRDTLTAANVRFLVCVFPMLSQLEPELYPLTPVHAMVTDFCEREGIQTLDLLPAFLAYEGDEQGLWVHSSDQHANDIGHAIQAEQIHAFLRQRQLLPR